MRRGMRSRRSLRRHGASGGPKHRDAPRAPPQRPPLARAAADRRDEAGFGAPLPVGVVGEEEDGGVAVEGGEDGVEIVGHVHLPQGRPGAGGRAREADGRLPLPQVRLEAPVRVAGGLAVLG